MVKIGVSGKRTFRQSGVSKSKKSKHFFLKSDYTSLNCHLTKFDFNLTMVNG